MENAIDIYENAGLLNANKRILSFEEALKEVQEYISKKYAIVLKENTQENQNLAKAYIEKYIDTEHIEVVGMTKKDLVSLTYGEMTGFSFLSKYLQCDNIEEININQWDDVKITYSNGQISPTSEKFISSQHSIDVVKRMLHKSRKIIDGANPIVVGHLSNKIRITAIGEGVIDDGKGVSASIRFVNPKMLTKKDFVTQGTATDEMLEFLSSVYIFGVSMCVTGATSSGKTTLMSWILSQIPDSARIVTIEQNVREFDLVKRNENNEVINNVIHLRTRPSDDPKQNIGYIELLATALTISPDNLCIAEMKGAEAFETVMAANTGHPLITTIHANSCLDTYYRILMLCKLTQNISDETLMTMVTKAFPIGVFAKRLIDNSRRIMEVTECVGIKDGIPIMRTLYRYKVIETKFENGKAKVIGYHEKVNNISSHLKSVLINNGIDLNLVEKF
ncbi:MAG: ATPase, T2SS/T4P/T4SS family [Clostridia bacterium]